MALSDQVQAAIEKFCNTKFSATALTQKFDGGHDDMIVKIGPIISVTSVTNNTTAVAVTTTAYAADLEMGAVYRVDGSKWDKDRQKWTLAYSGGYAAIPDDIQLAIDMWVDYLTTNASGAVKSYKTGDDSETYYDIGDMPHQVRALIAPYRRIVYWH
jgi:hypothetical protein